MDGTLPGALRWLNRHLLCAAGYKAKPVGAYLLEKPSGEVSGLITAAQTAAEAEQQAAETSAALPDEADYPSE